jgi:hypothetical protein
MKNNVVFPIRRLFAPNAAYDPAAWKSFTQYRNMKGPTQNFEGVNQTGIFCFMEFALWIPQAIIPDMYRSEHSSALDALIHASDEKTAFGTSGKKFICARIAMRYTAEFHQVANSIPFKNAMKVGSLPVIILQNFIIQRSGEKYCISSQDLGHNKSKIVLLGKINNDLKFDNVA